MLVAELLMFDPKHERSLPDRPLVIEEDVSDDRDTERHGQDDNPRVSTHVTHHPWMSVRSANQGQPRSGSEP